MPIIETRNLSKRFKDLLAVDDVNLSVEEGECFGLLGPNGAGTTSLIRMITAVSPPHTGEITVDGLDVAAWPREIKAVLGVVPQIDNLDQDLTVIQNLTTFARYFGIDRREAEERGHELLRRFRLEEKTESRIKELSGGMKRTLLIARGLVNRPRIAILDEPTVGLDPQARRLVWRQLREMREEGITLLLCTQNMEEAAVLCDRVAVMHLGRVLTIDTPEVLVATHVGEEVLEITVRSSDREGIAGELAAGGIDYVDLGDSFQIAGEDGEKLPEALRNRRGGVKRRPATLEDVFFRLTGMTLEDE